MKQSIHKRLPGIAALCIVTAVMLSAAARPKQAYISPPPPQDAAISPQTAQETILAALDGKHIASTKTASHATTEGKAETRETPHRYDGIELTDADITTLAALVFLEAGNQSAEGQQAVAEVVLNRVLADNFPNTVEDVIFDRQYGVQFTPAQLIPDTEPTQAQYDAVDAALHGEPILPPDVVYFSRSGENSRVWGTIGAHVFCRQYEGAES